MASKDSLDKADTATWPHIHPISNRVCKRYFYFLVVVLVMEPSTLYMLGKRSTTATLSTSVRVLLPQEKASGLEEGVWGGMYSDHTFL